jgi:hypothetical protein
MAPRPRSLRSAKRTEPLMLPECILSKWRTSPRALKRLDSAERRSAIIGATRRSHSIPSPRPAHLHRWLWWPDDRARRYGKHPPGGLRRAHACRVGAASPRPGPAPPPGDKPKAAIGAAGRAGVGLREPDVRRRPT